MTDPTDETGDADLDPQLDDQLDQPTEDAVRRLLADARHTEPMPPELAARLDTLLGQLVETRTAESNVRSLADHRRGRGRLLLVAAAAAVIVGVAVPTINRSSGNDAATTAADGAGSAAESSSASRYSGDSAAGGTKSAPQDQAATSTPPTAPAPAPSAPAAAEIGAAYALTAATFDADVARIASSADGVDGAAKSYAAELAADADCPSADYGAGELVGATYDGVPAVLAFRPSTDDVQVVDLLACGTAALIRTTTVPVSR